MSTDTKFTEILNDKSECKEVEIKLIKEDENTLQNRLISKNWKTRSDAYLELSNTFASSHLTEILPSHQHSLSKYIGDSNPMAQESALTAFKALFPNGLKLIAPQIPEIILSLLEKCVASSRSNIHKEGMQVLLDLSTSEIGQLVKDNLIDCCDINKSPKVVIGSMQVLCEFLSKNGSKALDLDKMFKLIEKQATTSSNAMVRAQALTLYKKTYDQLGEKAMAYIEKLKPVQQEELKQKISGSTARKSVGKSRKQSIKSDNLTEHNTRIDLSSSSETATPLITIDESMKWNEKKARLDEFVKACNAALIETGSIIETINVLSISLRDTNIMVINSGLMAIGTLAKYTSITNNRLVPLVIEQYKNKKVMQAVNFCLNEMFPDEKIINIYEFIKEELVKKSAVIKIHVCHWLEERLANAEVDQGVIEVLLKFTDDSSAELRDAAYSCLAIIKLTTNAIEKLSVTLTQQKIDRINKSMEIIKAKRDGGSISKPTKLAEEYKISSTTPNEELQSNNKQSPAMEVSNEVDSNTSFKKIVPGQITSLILKDDWKERQQGLAKLVNWINKERDKAKQIGEELILFVGNSHNGFKEKNISIFKELINLLQVMVGFQVKNKYLVDLAIPELLEKLTDAKWTDPFSTIILGAAKGSGYLVVIQKILGKLKANSKNPLIVKGALIALTKLVESQTLDLTSSKTIIERTKEYLSNPSKDIRTLGNELFVKLYNIGGKEIKAIFESSNDTEIKNAISEVYKPQSETKTEVKKTNVEKKTPVREKKTPVRENKTARVKKGEKMLKSLLEREEQKNKGKSREDRKYNLEPKKVSLTIENITLKSLKNNVASNTASRVDLLSQISQELIDAISDVSVKKRQKAKEQLKVIIEQATKICSIGLGPLISALKERINDPSKTLRKDFIKIIGILVKGMGFGAKQYVKSLVPVLANKLQDKGLTKEALNNFYEAAGTPVITLCIQTINKELPQHELLIWIIKHKKEINKNNSLELLNACNNLLQEHSIEGKSIAKRLISLILPFVSKEQIKNKVKSIGVFNTIEDIALNEEGREKLSTELEENCKKYLNPKLVKLMFGNEKDKLEAIKLMSTAISNGKHIINVLDLLLTWIQQVLDHALSLLEDVLISLAIDDYQMTDFEANLIFPSLVSKLEDNMEILNSSFRVYPPIWNLVISFIPPSNTKALLLLLNAIDENDVEVSKIGKIFSNSNSEEVKNSCKKLLSVMHKQRGDRIWEDLDCLSKEAKEELSSTIKPMNSSVNEKCKLPANKRSVCTPNYNFYSDFKEETKSTNRNFGIITRTKDNLVECKTAKLTKKAKVAGLSIKDTSHLTPRYVTKLPQMKKEKAILNLLHIKK